MKKVKAADQIIAVRNQLTVIISHL